MKNAIIFHDSLISLHQHVPKEILPNELGGKIGNFDNNECAQAVFSIENHFNRVHEMVKQNKHLYT